MQNQLAGSYIIWVEDGTNMVGTTHVVEHLCPHEHATHLVSEEIMPKEFKKVGVIDFLPVADLDLRDAWRWNPDTQKIYVDLAAAKDVTKARLRLEREPLLAETDKQFLISQKTGDDALKVASMTERARLLAITDQVEACSTFAQLRAVNCKA